MNEVRRQLAKIEADVKADVKAAKADVKAAKATTVSA
jgi:hypothetical protein